MNIYITAAVKELKEKLNAYLSLLSYRYANLCVKAELGALLPVTVMAERDYNLEDVAKVATPDDFRFEIYPNVPDHLQAIIAAILEVHPEFKMETASIDGSGETDKRYLLYTMPDVDKNRHDFLENAIKVLHEECCARIEAIHLEFKERLVENMVKISQAETDEAVDALDDLRKKSLAMADNQLEKKQQEIDEALEHYQEEQVRKAEENPEFDYTKGFRMTDSEW